jgi:hypothetical protein
MAKTKKYADPTTTSEYWDCECETNYIPKRKQPCCRKCRTSSKSQPDSRVAEVKAANLPLTSVR